MYHWRCPECGETTHSAYEGTCRCVVCGELLTEEDLYHETNRKDTGAGPEAQASACEELEAAIAVQRIAESMHRGGSFVDDMARAGGKFPACGGEHYPANGGGDYPPCNSSYPAGGGEHYPSGGGDCTTCGGDCPIIYEDIRRCPIYREFFGGGSQIGH